MSSDFFKNYIANVLAQAAENPHLALALQLAYAREDRQVTGPAYDLARTCENPQGDLALLAGALKILDGVVPAEANGTGFRNLTSNLMDAGFLPDREFSRPALDLIARIDAVSSWGRPRRGGGLPG